MTTHPDMFPMLNRTLSRTEAAEAFAKLKADVAGMDFSADTLRGICRAGAQGWTQHSWLMAGTCKRCGNALPTLHKPRQAPSGVETRAIQPNDQ